MTSEWSRLLQLLFRIIKLVSWNPKNKIHSVEFSLSSDDDFCLRLIWWLLLNSFSQTPDAFPTDPCGLFRISLYWRQLSLYFNVMNAVDGIEHKICWPFQFAHLLIDIRFRSLYLNTTTLMAISFVISWLPMFWFKKGISTVMATENHGAHGCCFVKLRFSLHGHGRVNGASTTDNFVCWIYW